MVIINFPKRLKCSKSNPLEDFYSKCMKTLRDYKLVTGVIDTSLKRVQVWAFSVCREDYKKLTKTVTKYLKTEYPELSLKKIQFNVGLIMLDIGPRIDNTVELGKVKIKLENLYENRNNED
jgi:hypothetical protein